MSQPPIVMQPNPAYGQAPAYGVQPGYEAQPPGIYGPTQPGYAVAPQQGGHPPQGYGGPPQQGYGGPPQQGYGAPPQQQWMVKPQGVPGCPPGLEYLTQVDQLLVHQQVELLEAFTGWETNNKYLVKNSMGQRVFFAAEDTDVCMRQCCGPARGFTIHIVDNANQEVMRVVREFKCCAGCCWCACSDCCAFEVRVEAPVGTPIGYVRQMQSCWSPYYDILDASKEPVLRIKGPCCICQGPCCTWDQEFEVMSADMSDKVGKVSKQWSGLVKELFTDATNFGVNFPIDLDVKVKATLLGAVFLIDFMFFEQNQQQQSYGTY